MSDGTPKPSGLAAKVDKKRKRQAEDSKPNDAKPTGSNSEGPNKKRKGGKNFNDRKNKGKGKGKKDEKGKSDQKPAKKEPADTKVTETKGGIDEAIGKMDGRLLADHFVQKARRHNKELSAVELSDLSVPGKLGVSNTGDWSTDGNRFRVPGYVVVRSDPISGAASCVPEGVQPE